MLPLEVGEGEMLPLEVGEGERLPLEVGEVEVPGQLLGAGGGDGAWRRAGRRRN